MSTRSQVKVLSEEPEDEFSENVTLYHHTDGYPGYMIPLIYKGWKSVTSYKNNSNFYLFQVSRPGHIASHLCSVDTWVFEPESGHELHGDIEWYYKVWVNGHKNNKNIKIRGKFVGEWVVEIYKTIDVRMDGPTKIELIYSDNITKLVNKKGELRVDVARKIKKITEGSYIGVEFAGKHI